MGKSNGGFVNVFYGRLMPMIYGIGASVVLVGVMFKLLYWPGANFFLIVGLGTEAIIFFLSAFEPRGKEFDWSIVYPELEDPNLAAPKKPSEIAQGGSSISRQLDNVLESANVGPELVQSLGNGLKSLSENVANMSKISNAIVATNEYAENIRVASDSITKINQSYVVAAESLENFSNAMHEMAQTSTETQHLKEELYRLNNSLASLNKVYGGMLSAMKG